MKAMFGRRKFILFSILILAAAAFPSVLRAERWSRKYINSLPDSAFASIEIRSDGKKVRHLPHHDHTEMRQLSGITWRNMQRSIRGKH
jgi:hypothetical protein